MFICMDMKGIILMNNVSLIGRLTADPEIKYTQNQKAFTRFTVAVDRPVKSGEEKQADFINIVAWDKTADFICKYFTKGQRIALTGTIRTGSYTDKGGDKRYTFEVWANNVEFCESKKEAAPAANQNQESEKPTATYREMPSGDDLPF